ncbi:MAG: hypothetical protein WD269_06415 [Acidimicrobiia bacterium]
MILVAFTAIACSQAASLDGPQQGDLESFLAETRKTQFDYEPTTGPAELAGLADLVVRGRIVGAEPGQLYAPLPDEPPAIATTVVAVEVIEVLAGDKGLIHENRVYMEVAHPAFYLEMDSDQDLPTDSLGEPVTPPLEPYDTAAFAATVPRMEGVFFLDDITSEPYWETVIDKGAGRPSGVPLTAAYVEGFILVTSDGRLIGVTAPIEDLTAGWERLTTVGDLTSAIG